MNKLLLALLTLVVVGCAESHHVHHIAETEEPQSEASVVLAEENEYRLGLGQTVLSQGLSCQLATITGGSRIQASIPGHNTLTGITNVATFLLDSEINQPDSPISAGLNVLPSPLRTIYKNMYKLTCQGYIVVVESDYYEFNVSSDDASVLYVGGTKVVDNDNNHAVTSVSGFKYLRRGVHAFKLEYAQAGGGNQALIVKADGSLIDPSYLTH